MNSGCPWKITLRGFSDKCGMGYKRKRGLQDDSKVDRMEKMMGGLS